MASAIREIATADATDAKIGFQMRGKHDIYSTVQDHKFEDRL